jgi:hypothetical protein
MTKQNDYLSDREIQLEQLKLLQAILKLLQKGQSYHHASLELLDNADLMRILKVSESKLKTMRNDKTLKFYKVGNKIVYRVCDVEEMLGMKAGPMRIVS